MTIYKEKENLTRVNMKNGVEIWISYSTPIIVFKDNKTWISDEVHSNTTAKHYKYVMTLSHKELLEKAKTTENEVIEVVSQMTLTNMVENI